MASSRRPPASEEAETMEERIAVRVLRYLQPEERSNTYRFIAELGRVAGYPDSDALAALARSVALLCVVLGSG